MYGAVAEGSGETSVGERATERRPGGSRIDPGVENRDEILSNAFERSDQWAFCGSDQAESLVTTSISRSSWATT